MVFDSYNLINTENIHDNLVLYLNEEIKKKLKHLNGLFTKENIKIKNLQVPQQRNGDDCGLYSLHNVESFYMVLFN